MYAEIVNLENRFNDLLPKCRLNQSPGEELLRAGRAWANEAWNFGQAQGPLPLTSEQLIQGKKLAQHPVFICGVHRSGTTLVRDLLDGHPELSVLPSEGCFLTNMIKHLQRMPSERQEQFLVTEWLRRLANPINQPPYWLMGSTTTQHSPYVHFARAFRSWYAAAKANFSSQNLLWQHLAIILAYATCSVDGSKGLNAKYWVDKTPGNEKYLPTLWQQMPQAKIIHIIRDPLDVFLSRKGMEPGLDVKSCLADMKLSYKTAIELSVSNRDNYLLLRYEDLCKAPGNSVTRICDFLNIEQHPCLFIPTVAGKPANVNSSFSSDLPAGVILKHSAHKTGLQTKDRQLLSAYLFDVATQLGYDLTPVNTLQSSWIRLKFELQRHIPGNFAHFF